MEPKHNQSTHTGSSRGVAAFIGFGLIVLLVMLVLGILPRMRQRSSLSADAQAVRAATAVITTTPHAAVVPDLELPGDTQAIEDATVYARTSGYLARRLVDIGSHVKAGDLLAEIESPEVQQQLNQANAQTEHSRASIGQARAEVTRSTATVRQSESEIARMRAAVEQAKADVARAEANVEQARASESNAASKLETAQSLHEARKADVTHSIALSDIAEKTLNRWRKLVEQRAVSQQDLDQKQSDYDGARAAVASAEATVRSAQSDVDAAKHMVDAAKAETQAEIAGLSAARQSVEAANAAVTSSQASAAAAVAGVASSAANVHVASADYLSNGANAKRFATMQSFSRVTAPFSGVITARNVDVGALINAGAGSATDTSAAPHSGLFGIARTDVLRIEVSLPQSSVNSVKQGQLAKVTFQEYPGRTFQGSVYRLAGALDTATRTLQAEIHIDNKNGALLPGMYANVSFASSGHTVLHIPSNTLVVNAAGTRVATLTTDNRVHFVPVRIGRDFGTELEIVEGLKGDEKLVASPGDDLREGQEVAASTSPAPTK